MSAKNEGLGYELNFFFQPLMMVENPKLVRNIKKKKHTCHCGSTIMYPQGVLREIRHRQFESIAIFPLPCYSNN